MKKIKRKLKIFFKNAKITEFFQKNTEKGAKIQEIQRKLKNTEQILKYRVIESSVTQNIFVNQFCTNTLKLSFKLFCVSHFYYRACLNASAKGQ